MINYYCAWKETSKVQRHDEINRGDGLVGTKNYADQGCYSGCLGLDKLCGGYFNKEITKIERLNKIIHETKKYYKVTI